MVRELWEPDEIAACAERFGAITADGTPIPWVPDALSPEQVALLAGQNDGVPVGPDGILHVTPAGSAAE